MRTSPAMQGLRLAFRQPALGLAEVVWRWTFAAAFWLLFCFLLFEYLDSLSVTKGDLLLLGSGVPSLVLGAIQRILLSGAHRFLVALFICLIAICIAWVFAASVRRAATISVLLDQAAHAHASEATNALAATPRLSADTFSRLISKAVVLLHLWRAALLLATLFAWVGVVIAAAFFVSGHDAHPGIAFLLFFVLSGALLISWYALDWLLSMAPIFAIRDDETATGSISGALTFVCDRFGAVVRASTLFGVMHVIIFLGVTSLLSAPLALARILPPGAVFLLIAAVTLLYFVLSDFLRVARFAAYIGIADSAAEVRPAHAG